MKYLMDLFFTKDIKKNRTVSFLFLGLLFAAGIVHWLVFLHSGDISFNFSDWPKEREYLKIIKKAVTENIVPYFISDEIHMTDKFMGMVETIISPQIILLKYMDIGGFFCVHTVLLYILGFVGCLLIRKKFKLSLFSFFVLFMLFNFNGYIISRIGVGHAQWLACLLLPYFVLFVFELIEGRDNLIVSIKIALFMFVILMQGSFHLYIWCLIFLIILMLFNRKTLKPVISSIIFGWLLSAFRILPGAIAYYGKSKGGTQGYSSVYELFESMTALRDYSYHSYSGSLGWFELNLYVDFIGFLIIIYFGVVLSIKAGFLKKEKDNGYFLKNDFRPVYLSLFVLIFLSFNRFYALIDSLPLPLLNSQSVSARFIIVPFVFILVIAVIRFNDFTEKIKTTGIRLMLIAGVLLMTASLVKHSELWRVKRLDTIAGFGALYNMSAQIINKEDSFYFMVVKYSYAVSAVTLAALLLFVFIHRRKTAVSIKIK